MLAYDTNLGISFCHKEFVSSVLYWHEHWNMPVSMFMSEIEYVSFTKTITGVILLLDHLLI